MSILGWLEVDKLKRDGGVAYTERNTTALTFDGDKDGKLILPGSMIGWDEVDYVKVTDEVIYGGACGLSIVQNGESIHYDENKFTTSCNNDAYGVGIDGYDYVISVSERASSTFGVDVGTYFAMYTDGSGYVSEVRTETETVHPIDPKYLVKTINLADIMLTNGGESVTLDSVVDSLSATAMQTAFTDGSCTKTVEVTGASAFWEAVNTERQIRIINHTGGFDFENNALVIRQDGVVVQVATPVVLNANVAVLDMDYSYQACYGDTDRLIICVKATATPLT